MIVSLSSAMSRSLNALINTNQDMEAAQNRINTGKSVNDPSDNIAIYFKARSYTDRADAYDNVNAQITQGVSNLAFVDKALSNMIDNVKGARQMLTDAKAKAVAGLGAAVGFTGAKAYANTTVTVAGTPPTSRTITGNIVDTAAGANVSDGSVFQGGDVFAVTIKDSSSTGTSIRYFKAVAADSTSAPNQSNKGDTVGNAIEFNDVASLANALNLGFGRATASFDAVAGSVPGTTQLKMQLASNTQQITFGQVNDVSVGAGATTTTGASFDFTKLLQNASTKAAIVTVGNSLDATNAAAASSWTYASPPSATGTTDQSVIDARKQAADFFRQTIYGLDATVKDAYLPGFANILKGDTMTVQLNDTNTVSQSVKLASAVDFSQADTTATFGIGFKNNAGTLTTAYTDGKGTGSDNFMDDTRLTNAMAKLDAISVALGQQRQLIAAANTAMSSRLDLNKTLQSTMTDTANSLTAADIATESANLAALQNRQSFAATGMTITRQSEQMLLNLIR